MTNSIKSKGTLKEWLFAIAVFPPGIFVMMAFIEAGVVGLNKLGIHVGLSIKEDWVVYVVMAIGIYAIYIVLIYRWKTKKVHRMHERIDVLTKQINDHPKEYELYKERAETYLWLAMFGIHSLNPALNQLRLSGGDPSLILREKAIENLTKAIKLNPNKAELFRSRADVYFNLGEEDKSEKDYKKALELNPEDYYASEMLESFKNYQK